MSGLRDRAARIRRRLGAVATGAEADALRAQIGGVEARLAASLPPGSIREAEFSVFSQFGEDGIIQHLVRNVPIENEAFVEFGVEDYSESNTRFLLVHDNWRGLVMDGGSEHIAFLEASGLRWRHEIHAVSAFVDRDNINRLIRDAGFEGDIGLLSVDIDGNDYWVLEAIDAVSPRILVTEYNSAFGPDRAVTVPYDPSFRRLDKHSSGLYWGASLAALESLARRKGYALVGGNRAGNNAFFVRRDVLGELPEVDVRAAWSESRFRESRSPEGELTYVTGHRAQLRLIRDLPLVDLDGDGSERAIAELYGA